MKQRIRIAALLSVAAATAILPLATGSGGTAFRQPKPVVAHADGGAYDKLAVDLAAATAFDDARNDIKSAPTEEAGDKEDTFWASLRSLTRGSRFGNVGLFVGPKGSSKNSDVWSVFQSKVSIDAGQIQAYDDETGGAFSKYKAFGGAIQKLNGKAQKTKGSSSSIQKGLDELSAAGAKMTNLGTEIISEYNPAPILLSFLDANELNTHPNNKLVALLNGNRTLREFVKVLGTPTRFGVPMSFLIMFFGAFLLLVTSVLMTLINGRAAGENIRKMMVKVLIGCVAVQLVAKALDLGISFLDTQSAIQANAPASNYVEQNLNLADWYACGFSIPSGTTVYIDKDGEFNLSPEAIRAINTFTYEKVWGRRPSDTDMVEKMEEYYTMFKAFPMVVGFSEPVTQTGGRTGKPWRTKNFYEALSNFGQNEPLLKDLEFDESGSSPDVGNIGYFASNGLSMSPGGSGYAWSVSGQGNRYGISPIAATNLMRTSFTGSAMTVNSNNLMGGVVFDIDNGAGAGTNNMSSLTRFLATFAMVMAGMKGLFTIFTAGFGGIFSGGAKSAMGSTQGAGQALGGVLALVGGVFGVSIIMTMSFTLLDQLYGVMDTLLHGTTAGNDILEPFREAVHEIPLFGPVLDDAAKSVARLVLTILCAITLPKFGGIPVTLFCQYLSELPHRMAERAQQIENKFTGDFRGGGGGFGRGGGGMGSASSMMNQAANQGVGQLKGVGRGAAAVAGAAFGYAASAGGRALERGLKGKDMGEESASMSESGTEAESTGTPDADLDGAPATESLGATGAEPGESPYENNGYTDDRDTDSSDVGDGPGFSMDDGASLANNTSVDGNDLKETEKESLSDHEGGDSYDDSYSQSDSSSLDAVDQSTLSDASSLSESMQESDALSFDGQSEFSLSDSSSMSESASEQATDSEASATSSMSVEQDAQDGPDGSPSAARDGDGHASMADRGPGSREPGHASMSGSGSTGNASSASGTSGKAALTQEQKKNRRMMAVAKGLQAAGGHATKGQAIAGALAGAAHMAGSRISPGAQNFTGKGISAVRNYRQRQNDIRDGLPVNYSQSQRQRTEQEEASRRKPNTGNGNAGNGGASRRASYQQQNELFAEALAREAEERQRQAAARSRDGR